MLIKTGAKTDRSRTRSELNFKISADVNLVELFFNLVGF